MRRIGTGSGGVLLVTMLVGLVVVAAQSSAASPSPTPVASATQGAMIDVTPAGSPHPSATQQPVVSPSVGKASPPTYFPARGNEPVPLAPAAVGVQQRLIQVRDAAGNPHDVPVIPVDISDR